MLSYSPDPATNFEITIPEQKRHAKLVLIGQFVGSKLVVGSGEQELKINVFFLLIDQYFTQ